MHAIVDLSWGEEIPAYEGTRLTMDIEAPETFKHPCGFIRLRERHRVKAPSIRYGKAAEQQEA